MKYNNNYGIKVIQKLPGVGKNLQDHHEVPFISRAKQGYGYFKQDKGLRKIKNGIQYLLFKSGPVASTGRLLFIFKSRKVYWTKITQLWNVYCVKSVLY